MNMNDLKKSMNRIRLPEDSKERIIRNLEKIKLNDLGQTDSEEYHFDVVPARTPVLRYAITSLAACAVLAFTAVGIYAANKGTLLPAAELPQPTQSMQSATVNLFTESPLFAVMGADASPMENAVDFHVLTNEQKEQFSAVYRFLDWNHAAAERTCDYDEAAACYLYYQQDNLWYSLQAVKDENGDGWIQKTCLPDATTEGNTELIQVDASVIDEIKSVISNGDSTRTASMNYFDAVADPFSLIELMCCNVAYHELMTLSIELDTDRHQACFMTADPDNNSIDEIYSGVFYIMGAEQKQKLATLNLNELLMNMQYYSDFHMESSSGNTIQTVLYLDNGAYLEFCDSNCIVIHNLPSVPGEDFVFEIDAPLMEQYVTLFEGFKVNCEHGTMSDLTYEKIMNLMFINSDMPQVIELAKEIFCNLDQAELYFNNEYSFYLFENQYPSQYYSISEAKQKELAELFAGLPYDNMKECYENGGYRFVMYLQDKDLKQYIVTFLFYEDFDCAYMTWHPDGLAKQSNYYLELDLETLDRIAGIIAEPEQLYRKENSLFEFDDTMFTETKEMLAEASVQYGAFLDKYNQAHGTQLRFPTADECLEAGISESKCFDFFRTELPDEEAFFRYVDILVERRETVISNFHRVELYASRQNPTEMTGYHYDFYNASGQTYGVMGPEGRQGIDVPDLIAVQTVEGQTGYLPKEVIFDDPVKTLEEAAAYMEELERRKENGIKYIVVDAYASDGKTVVGTFHTDCIE